MQADKATDILASIYAHTPFPPAKISAMGIYSNVKLCAYDRFINLDICFQQNETQSFDQTISLSLSLSINLISQLN